MLFSSRLAALWVCTQGWFGDKSPASMLVVTSSCSVVMPYQNRLGLVPILRFSGVGVTVQGGSECVPDVPLSGNTSQFFLGIPRRPQARWDILSNPSSAFWIYCWVSSHLDVPGRLPKGGVRSGPTPTLQLMPTPNCLFILCPNFLHHLWRRPQAEWFISDWTNF